MSSTYHQSCNFLLQVALVKFHAVLDRFPYSLAMLLQHLTSTDNVGASGLSLLLNGLPGGEGT